MNDSTVYILSQDDTPIIQRLDLSNMQIVKEHQLATTESISNQLLTIANNELIFSENQQNKGFLSIFDMDLTDNLEIRFSKKITGISQYADSIFVGFGYDNLELGVDTTGDATAITSKILTYSFITIALDDNEEEIVLDVANLQNSILYPNPVEDYLLFKTNIGTISIYSTSGRLIKNASTNVPVDVANIPVGLYFIKDSKGNTYKFYKK